MLRNYDRSNINCKIGEVYMMRFSGVGSAQRGWRPGIVFQNNVGNRFSPNIIALPLTSSIKKTEQPTHVMIRAVDSGLKQDSMALCENPAIISKEFVGEYITTLSDSYMKKITTGYLLATSAISYLDAPSLLDAWKNAAKLNQRTDRLFVSSSTSLP